MFKVNFFLKDYMFENKWNNFLHIQILNIITNLLNVNNQTPNLTNNSFNNSNEKQEETSKVVVNGNNDSNNGDNSNENSNNDLHRSVIVILEHVKQKKTTNCRSLFTICIVIFRC